MNKMIRQRCGTITNVYRSPYDFRALVTYENANEFSYKKCISLFFKSAEISIQIYKVPKYHLKQDYKRNSVNAM